MWFVYVLKSINHPFLYVGMTKEVEKRVESHNAKLNQSTKHYAPFTLEFYVAVKTERKARELEKYFKGGSGKAFVRKHFLGGDDIEW
ncbi:MAG: GIY-YIG nuclease family protein [Cyclobacteriaceae bacterium]